MSMFETKEKKETQDESWNADFHNGQATKANREGPSIADEPGGGDKKGDAGSGGPNGGMGGDGDHSKNKGDVDLTKESFSSDLHEHRNNEQAAQKPEANLDRGQWSDNSPREGLHDSPTAPKQDEVKHQ